MKKMGTGDYKIWVISGQHPGETVNMWMLEGFLERLSNGLDNLLSNPVRIGKYISFCRSIKRVVSLFFNSFFNSIIQKSPELPFL